MKLSKLSLLFVFFFSSCNLISGQKFPDLADFVEVTKPAKEVFLNQLTEENNLLKSARGKFEIDLKNTLGTKSFKEVFVFQRPDHLRIEFFATALNKLLGLVLLKEDELKFYDLEGGVLYLGDNSAASFYQITQLPFSAEELMHWFCAKFYLENSPEISYQVYKNTLSKQRAILKKSAKESTLVFFKTDVNKNTGLGNIFIDSIEVRDSESKARFYSKFAYQNETGAIKEIEISIPQESLKGKIVVQSIKYNPNLGANFEKLFNFEKDLPVKYLAN